MTDNPYAQLDATDQAALVAAGKVSPTELVDAAIARIERVDPDLHAVIHPRFERARAEAAGALPDGPFRGVPMVVKDLDGSLAGEPLHLGNRLLAELGHTAPVTSWLVQRFIDAGFVIVGKTNTPEFGLLPTTEPLAHGPTRNPWDTGRGPGGSSGGSAAAVASGMVPVGHAGDGGGSIRIPASACGLVGLKPARGRITMGPDEGESWGGLVARHVVTRSVRDSAAILDAVAGPGRGDPYAAAPPARPYRDEVGADPGRLRVGVRTAAPAGVCETHPDCVAAAEAAGRMLEGLGHTVEDASPAAWDEPELLAMFTTVLNTSVRLCLDDLEAIAGRPVTAHDVEPATWALAELGASVSGTDYVAALRALHRWSREVAVFWEDDGYDLLLTPTLAEPPPMLGDVVAGPDEPLLALVRATPFAAFTVPSNVTGQPAISLPLHVGAGGLPIGVQLVAGAEREDVLVRVAAQLEAAHPWHDRWPPVRA